VSTLEEQLAFLRERGAGESAHSQSDLLGHLIGTHRLLVRWGAEPEVCTAGLFHAIYGTETFGAIELDVPERDAVRALVGERCESLVHTFASTTRESLDDALAHGPPYVLADEDGAPVPLSPRELADLCNLAAANWLDQLPRIGDGYAELGRDRYARMLGVVLPAARQALREVYGFG
jgi:hypothetical protein